MALGPQFIPQNGAGLFRHRVVTAGEHIHGGITALGPGVDGDVRFRQQGQSRDALGLEAVGDQIEKGGTSTFRCCRDGGSQECFVVEPGRIAVVKLENAVFANHVGCTGVGCTAIGRPSRVGVQAGQGLLHQDSLGK